ncbi:MAG: MarR family winged helix-turn-helix transcriptional regulator [Sarcina sp.]
MDKKNNNKRISLSAFIALKRANQYICKREMTTIKSTGLTVSQFAVLEILYSKGDLTVGEIIDGILSTSGNMTVVLKNLEKEGYIEKYKGPNDKRSFIVKLTNKGYDLIHNSLPTHLDNINNFMNVLDEEEQKTLIRILKKIKK